MQKHRVVTLLVVLCAGMGSNGCGGKTGYSQEEAEFAAFEYCRVLQWCDEDWFNILYTDFDSCWNRELEWLVDCREVDSARCCTAHYDRRVCAGGLTCSDYDLYINGDPSGSTPYPCKDEEAAFNRYCD